MKRLLRTKRGRRRCGYTQRWQAETTPSMIKRNLTDELGSVDYWPQCREMRRLAIVHNIMILILSGGVFDGASQRGFRRSNIPFSHLAQPPP